MASWNKTLCLVTVICLLSVVLCSCKVIEGLQIDFNLCVDDPNWYVTTEDNERLSCSDVSVAERVVMIETIVKLRDGKLV